MRLIIAIEKDEDRRELKYEIPDVFWVEANNILDYIKHRKYLTAGRLLWKLLKSAKLL